MVESATVVKNNPKAFQTRALVVITTPLMIYYLFSYMLAIKLLWEHACCQTVLLGFTAHGQLPGTHWGFSLAEDFSIT